MRRLAPLATSKTNQTNRGNFYEPRNPTTDMSETKEDCIVVISKCCGRTIFAAVNKPNVVNAEMRAEIGELVALGHQARHATVEEVRKCDFGCKCNVAQPVLI